jgi:HPt (histidine-containing phosphotransfer) domain-containing protein
MNETRIDVDALSELKEMLEDEFGELIETYIRDVSNKMSQLKELIRGSDFVAVRELAHSIKGASVNIGVLKFGELCHRLEMAASEQNSGIFSEWFEQMSSEYEWVKNELTQF